MTETNALITLRQAARLTGYHPDCLSSLIQTGQLQGQKIGKTWVTTDAELRRFCEGNPTEDPAVRRPRLGLGTGSPASRRVMFGLLAVVVSLGFVIAWHLGYAGAMRTLGMQVR